MPKNKTHLWWHKFSSSKLEQFQNEDNDEQAVLDLFDNALNQQVDGSPQGGNTLSYKEFTKSYNCSDHKDDMSTGMLESRL